MNKTNMLLVMFLLIITFTCCEKEESTPILGIAYILAGDTTGCYFVDFIPDIQIIDSSYLSDEYLHSGHDSISLHNNNIPDITLHVSAHVYPGAINCGAQRKDTCFIAWSYFNIETNENIEIAVRIIYYDRSWPYPSYSEYSPLQVAYGEMIHEYSNSWRSGFISYSHERAILDSTKYVPVRKILNDEILYGWIKMYNTRYEYATYEDFGTTVYVYDKWIIEEYAIQRSRNI